MKRILTLLSLVLITNLCLAQLNENQLGAWYMYFFSTKNKSTPWGVQGDIQFRNWNTIGDLEQLLLRSGVTYKPTGTDIKFTLGIANITTGAFGDSKATVSETRIYQEALIKNKISSRFNLTHRFRYEQRFVEGQDLRTRYRYNLFLNIPLNHKTFEPKTVYLALYNELFINGQKTIGDNRTVEFFDRNRFYCAVGYKLKNNLKVQFGAMQQTTNAWSKNQLQASLHHVF